MGPKFTEWFGSILFAIIGIIFIIVGMSIFISSIEFKNNSTQGTAIITNIKTHTDMDGDTTHTVFVKYVVDNIQYNQQLNFYSSDMKIGKEIVIYYDPNSPTTIQAAGQDMFGLIFSGFGLLAFVIGIVMIINKIQRIAGRKQLLKNGKRLDATIEEVVLNSSYRVNNRSPYVITCKVIDSITGQTYLLKSDNIWYDPKPVIDERKLTTLPVYMDMNNPKKYYIVLDEISNKVIDFR